MFKVATWNVNSVNARLERIDEFLEKQQPDLVGLQEIKCPEEKFPTDFFRERGYQCAVYGQKTYNGVALLSKTPLTNLNKSFHDEKEDPQARFVSATTQGVHFASAYIPNGQELGSEAYFYKLEWLARLRAFFDRQFSPSQPVLLMGDFNVAPEPQDVWDPKVWEGKILFSAPEKAALNKVLEFGLSDTLRLHHTEGGLYSWWDYRALGFPKNHGLRIDFLFSSPPLTQVCKKAYIDRDLRKGAKPSDHAPVLAEFES